MSGIGGKKKKIIAQLSVSRTDRPAVWDTEKLLFDVTLCMSPHELHCYTTGPYDFKHQIMSGCMQFAGLSPDCGLEVSGTRFDSRGKHEIFFLLKHRPDGLQEAITQKRINY
jgi:hypothetical protein